VTKSSTILHHAHLLLGSEEEAKLFLDPILQQLNLTSVGNPDFIVIKVETFGISEARDFISMANRKSFSQNKIFLIIPEKLTIEAQNALLKAFEEPIQNTYIFLVLREAGAVIATLRSRLQIIFLDQIQSSNLLIPTNSSTNAKEFLDLSPRERIEFARRFADQEYNLAIFLDNLLKILRNKVRDGNNSLSQVFEFRRFASDRSPSSRLVLEHLALILR
jgi:DNA polymerase III delta prime subunit